MMMMMDDEEEEEEEEEDHVDDDDDLIMFDEGEEEGEEPSRSDGQQTNLGFVGTQLTNTGSAIDLYTQAQCVVRRGDD